jgi:hypothetical protein
MEHQFTLSGINASFLSSHMMELVIMLTGTILLSFVTARLFFKSSSAEKKLTTVEVTGTEAAVPEHAVYFNEGRIDSEKIAVQSLFSEKERTGNEIYFRSDGQLQQSYAEANLREEENEDDLQVKQAKHRDDCLYRLPKDFYAIRQSRETIDGPKESIAILQEENEQLTVKPKGYVVENAAVLDDSEMTATADVTEKIKMPVMEKKTFTAQLKELEQKKEKQAYTVVLLPKKEVAAPEAVVADLNEVNIESAKNEVPVNLLEDKLQLLQKERNDMMGQIYQLENRLKITYLTSLSKVDMEEEEENPIKRLTLYISMLEGEKQGLNNRIADLSKKLSLAEAGATQIQAKENELAYVKSRLAALEQDKRDVQSQSGEWEVMYKKLYEKTHYLLSAKETELEQLKTNISYLEKDKNRLLERIKDMENELRSTVFNYKGRSPLAFNL